VLMKVAHWFLVICFIALSSCHSSNANVKNKPQILRTSLCGDLLSLDPRKGVDMVSQGVVRMLFTGLVRLDENLNPRLELAASYRASNDFKTYVFTLKDSNWSDGSPITAYDFEETWKAALSPAYSSTCTNLFFHLRNGRKAFLGQVSIDQLGVKAVDDKTLCIELEVANPNFLNVLINSIFSPVHESMRYKLPDPEHLVCSGPFKLKRYVFQDQILLSRNSNYWNSRNVKLDELHYYIVKDLSTALLMFEKKELDWLGDPISKISPDSIHTLRSKGFLHTNPSAGLQWMFLNIKRMPLDNVHIRKALAFAIDRTLIMQELMHIEGMAPSLGLIPKIIKKERWHPWFVDNDIQEAKAQFEMGLKELNITRDQFPKVSITYATQSSDKILQAIQHMWKQHLGIDIILQYVDIPILYSKWYDHDYDIAWLGWLLQYNDPANMLEIFKYKNIQPNYSGWEHPEFIQHANASLSLVQEKDRWDHVEAAEKVFFDEMPSIPISDFVTMYVQQPYVKGVWVNPLFQIDFDRASIEDVR